MGTPAGTQDEFGVNWILPASISSLSFFIASLTHCFRLGLEMSPNRKLTPAATKMWPGSWRTGRADPCTGGNGPPKGCVHPPGPALEFGGELRCAAGAPGRAETHGSATP